MDKKIMTMPMRGLFRLASDRLITLVNWFIPEKLKSDQDVVQGIRMFLISHFFGPFLGHTISLYVLYIQGQPDLPWFVFFSAITLFWPLSFVLRMTGWYVPLAFVSIQNLLFCILWGCYHYGGINSPILPWLITVPLLAFFYLPSAKTRLLVSLLIMANLVGFFLIYSWQGFPATVPLRELSGLGFVSTLCAGLYVSMMALYYANVVLSQSELEVEMRRHLQTAQALGEATEQARRAVRAKSEFLSNMSHELRTPLNAIIGYSEMLIEETEAGDHQFADLQAINSAGRKLLDLINRLLDLSRLEAGRMELHLQPFALEGLVDEIDSEWRETIAVRGNGFNIERVGDLGVVVGDAAKLRQAVDSLLSNAAKHAGGGRVTMTVTHRDGWVAVAVRDTGPGMRPYQLATLFETFGKHEGETSSIYRDDPGIGLPLSQRLCRLMGGDLAVDSELGRGSCFTLRIPSAPQAQPPRDRNATMASSEPGHDAPAGRFSALAVPS